MKNPFKAFWTLCCLSILSGSAAAISVGTDITISDENYDSSGVVPGPTTWYGNHEDNETETNPNTINRQVWDLEGMYLNGTKLTLVGGFDFKNGTLNAGYTWKGGDLFIDVNGDAKFGQAANGGTGATGYGTPQPLEVANIFGYDYVLDIGAFSGDPGSVADAAVAFNIVQLNSSSVLSRGADVASSNPWTYLRDGLLLGSGVGSYGVLSNADAAAYGLLGEPGNNTHYYITLDLANVPGIWSAPDTFHYTLECGNDNLMGRSVVSVPDGGTSVLLFGLAILGMAPFRKKMCV